MSKQKGQASVEFAFVLPVFFMMFFAMIYGGMLFMDYMQCSNAARGVARAISLSKSDGREKLAADFKANTGNYVHQLTSLYIATPDVIFTPSKTPKDVTVTIDLTLNEDRVPKLLTERIKFPPKTLRAIEIVMPLEKTD